jgi:hypothetical protein
LLLWETPATARRDLDRIAALAARPECLVREDRQGSFILCSRGRAPEGVLERRLGRVSAGGRFGPRAGPWVFRVGIWTPADWRTEFCGWYVYEHAPMLLECPVWDGYQLFETPAARGCRFYVFHHLSARRALDSEERKRSRSTPWFRRLAKNKWFDGAFERVLTRRVELKAQ